MEVGKQISIEDVYGLLVDLNKNFTRSLEGVEAKLTDLRKQIDIRFESVNDKVKAIQEENIVLKYRLKQAERNLKAKNLIFYGIDQIGRETEDTLLQIIVKIIKENLNIVDFRSSEITNAYRIGKEEHNHRPVLVEFHSQYIRKEIIRKRTQLKGTRIFVREDLIEDDRAERKTLLKALSRAKRDEKSAYIKGNILIIEGTSYTYQDILNNKHTVAPPSQSIHSYSPLPDHIFSNEGFSPARNLEENSIIQGNLNTDHPENCEKIHCKGKETERGKILSETLEKATGTKSKKNVIHSSTQQRPVTRTFVLGSQK